MTEDEEQPEDSAARIVSAAMTAYERGDHDRLGTLVHPDAEIQMLLLGGEVVRGPEGLRGVLAREAEVVHEPTVTSIEAIGDDAAAIVGRIRYADPRGGLSDHPAVGLVVVRDGKVWRARALGSLEEARSAYEDMTGAGTP